MGERRWWHTYRKVRPELRILSTIAPERVAGNEEPGRHHDRRRHHQQPKHLDHHSRRPRKIRRRLLIPPLLLLPLLAGAARASFDCRLPSSQLLFLLPLLMHQKGRIGFLLRNGSQRVGRIDVTLTCRSRSGRLGGFRRRRHRSGSGGCLASGSIRGAGDRFPLVVGRVGVRGEGGEEVAEEVAPGCSVDTKRRVSSTMLVIE